MNLCFENWCIFYEIKFLQDKYLKTIYCVKNNSDNGLPVFQGCKFFITEIFKFI